MANNVYHAVEQYSSCARIFNRYTQTSPIKLFLTWKPLDFVATKNLGVSPTCSNSHCYLLVITAWCSNLTWAISSSKPSSTYIADILFYHRIVSYRIAAYIFPQNSSQFMIRYFATVCVLLQRISLQWQYIIRSQTAKPIDSSIQS